MRRHGPAVLLALTGAAILRISLFGDLYLRYVRPGLRPYLIVSGAALVLLAVTVTALARRGDGRGGRGEAPGQERGGVPRRPAPHGPRAAWLLALPALALLLFPPPALGSYSAEREAERRAARGVGTFPALPAGDPLDLTLGAFASRAVYDSGRSLDGRTVRLTGFVTRDDDGTWYVTRLLVSCCAADATTARAEIRGADGPPADTWVTVTGTWHPRGEQGSDAAWPPVLDVTDVRRTQQPANPYEKR
ncbi:TIGR03943 family putative permease subunit [Streptomyces bullii]|uniref:TIGR03943 family putative permease subunit n=1 Tax=Streptomyces bullii TaxID=349910 RepID=A0ABW0UM00_9ACTN